MPIFDKNGTHFLKICRRARSNCRFGFCSQIDIEKNVVIRSSAFTKGKTTHFSHFWTTTDISHFANISETRPHRAKRFSDMESAPKTDSQKMKKKKKKLMHLTKSEILLNSVIDHVKFPPPKKNTGFFLV